VAVIVVMPRIIISVRIPVRIGTHPGIVRPGRIIEAIVPPVVIPVIIVPGTWIPVPLGPVRIRSVPISGSVPGAVPIVVVRPHIIVSEIHVDCQAEILIFVIEHLQFTGVCVVVLVGYKICSSGFNVNVNDAIRICINRFHSSSFLPCLLNGLVNQLIGFRCGGKQVYPGRYVRFEVGSIIIPGGCYLISRATRNCQ